MKKILLMLSTTLFIVATAIAIPAKRGAVKITQPDGSTIMVSQFGDEFFHWIETTDGYNVVMGEDGFFYYDTHNSPSRVRAKDPAKRGAIDRSVLSQTYKGRPARANGINLTKRARFRNVAETQTNQIARVQAQEAGEKYHSIVVLVNYRDLKFTVPSPKEAFSRMLNQSGYSGNQATGSAWDYYNDNSNGQFDGSFDVFGPIELKREANYYGGESDAALESLMQEVVTALDGTVDWAMYSDDKIIRPIFIFFPGYNEAENLNYPNLIWPHMMPVGYLVARASGGYEMHSYACTSEYSGTYGYGHMAGIGTFCHEFGHVLGLPDFYDTDGIVNGSTYTINSLSLMDYGPYNNDGRTPPAMMAEERDLLGWLSDGEILTTPGEYTLPHISSDKAYKILTDTEGEYFWLETRGSSNKYDSYVFENGGSWGGMLVMHVDKSARYIDYWGSDNDVNAYSNHPCYLHIRASRASVEPSTGWFFPGSSRMQELNSASDSYFRMWSGEDLASSFTNISYSDGTVSFSYEALANSITLSPTSAEIDTDETISLTATILPADAYKNVTWSSSNPTVASVDENGVIRGISGGQAIITATTSNNKTAKCKVTVKGEIAVEKSVLQNDAILYWAYTGDETFIVELSGEGSDVLEFRSSKDYVYIPKLKANTNYVASLYLLDEGGDKIEDVGRTLSFQTLENSTEFVAMGLMSGTFTTSEEIPLRAINLPENVASISWYVDGNATVAPKVTLASGTHKIELIVKTDDNLTETIIRYITITE